MIIVWGAMEFSSNDFATAVEAALAVMRETRKEDGCLEYCFCLDLEQSNKLRFYERFRDDSAMAAHKEAAHYQLFRQQLADLEVISRTVNKHLVPEGVPVV